MSINKENFRDLIDHLNGLKVTDDAADIDDDFVGFNMAQFSAEDFDEIDMSGHMCGTTACIAGHAFMLSGRHLDQSTDIDLVSNAAQDWLGLDDAEAYTLFYGRGWTEQADGRMGWTTLEVTLDHLEHLLETAS